MYLADKCSDCEFYEDCEYADNYNFCEDCKEAGTCPIRWDSPVCKKGHEIECNNGFEEECYE